MVSRHLFRPLQIPFSTLLRLIMDHGFLVVGFVKLKSSTAFLLSETVQVLLRICYLDFCHEFHIWAGQMCVMGGRGGRTYMYIYIHTYIYPSRILYQLSISLM